MLRRTMLAALGVCVVLTASAALTKAQDKAGKSQPVTDPQFVLKASEDGLAEVNHGLLAAQRASSPEVKQFAQRMVKDHEKANKELLDLANTKGFKVASDMGAKHQAMQDRLTKLSGADFDRHYMQHMVDGHEKTVALFKAETKSGKDEGLRAFAGKVLPTIEDHLKMAKQIQGKLQAK